MKRLKSHPLFSNVNIIKNKSLSNGYFKKYSKGETINFEGDKCESLYLVINGLVEVEQTTPEGHSKTIHLIRSGGAIGVNVLFSSQPYFLLSSISKEDSLIFIIDKNSFLKSLSDNHLLSNFLTLLCDNTLNIGKLVKSSFKQTLRDKIIIYINKNEVNNVCRIKPNKTFLAKQFGVERTSLSRELQKMKKDGLIDYDRNNITIRSLSKKEK